MWIYIFSLQSLFMLGLFISLCTHSSIYVHQVIVTLNAVPYINRKCHNYNSFPFRECDLPNQTFLTVSYNMRNTTGYTFGAESAFTHGAHEIIPLTLQFSLMCQVFYILFLCLFFQLYRCQLQFDVFKCLFDIFRPSFLTDLKYPFL